MNELRKRLPRDFTWGVAAAAYQIEGAVDEGGRQPSIWDTFSHEAGRTAHGHTGDRATDHYHRYEEDVAIMSTLGVDAYRFSISWSRLMDPVSGTANPEGVAFYRRLCEALRANGIEPHATLYHWDLPQSLQDLGGWSNPESVGWFSTYARVAKESLGDLVHNWFTLNEPHCIAFLGHSSGVHAPGHTNAGEAYVVAHHLMLAHHAAISVMRATLPQDDDRLGIVLNLIPAWSDDPSPESREVAATVDAIHNRLFAGAVLNGTYPEEVLDIVGRLGVRDDVDTDRLADVVEPIDVLGVNYYNINHFAYTPGAPEMADWPGVIDGELLTPPGHLTEMGWGVEPVGLTWMLGRLAGWAPGLEVMVMENGAAYPDVVQADGSVDDPLRSAYIEAHIEAVASAIEEGANITGYFVWSLLDNFEWSLGYDKRFGIVRVDYDTMERTVKESGHWYSRFIRD